MTDQLGLFSAPPSAPPRLRVPSAADVVASGLTPMQWFERRYPRARNLRGEVLRDVVKEGVAAPIARSLWDSWYRAHYGEPVEVPLGS